MARRTIQEMAVALRVDTKQAQKADKLLEELARDTKKWGGNIDDMRKRLVQGHVDREFDKIARSLAKADDEAKKLGRDVGDIAGLMKFDLAIQGAQALAGAVAGAAGAVKDFITEGVEESRMLVQFADRTGTSVEELQKFQVLSKNTGVSLDDLADANKELNIRLGEGGEVTKDFKAAMKALGLDAKQLINLPMSERFARIADAMKRVGTEAERAAIIDKVMGGDAGEKALPILKLTGDEILRIANNTKIMSKEQLKAASSASMSFALLDNEIQGVKNSVLSALLPATRRVTDGMTGWISKNQELIDQRMGQIGDSLAKAIDSVAPEVAETVDNFANWIDKNNEWIAQDMPGQMVRFAKDIGTVVSVAAKAAVAIARMTSQTIELFRVTKEKRRQEDIAFVKKATPEQLAKIAKGVSFSGRFGDAESQRLARNELNIRANVLTQRYRRLGLPVPESIRRAAEQRQQEVSQARDRRIAKERGDLALGSHGPEETPEMAKTRKTFAEAAAGIDAAKKKGKKSSSKSKSAKGPTSKFTVNDVVDAVLSGQDPNQALRGIANDTPSTKDIKPTVAMDFFNFQITQNITATEPRQAGRESAEQIRAAFQAGKSRNPAAVAGNVVR